MNRKFLLVKTYTWYLSWFVLLLSITTTIAQARSKVPFPKNTRRILFLGNSITYAGKYITDIETYFIAHYPKQQYEFINLGLPSETVSGLSEPNHADGKFPRPDLPERLARVLTQVKPDVVFACYGMNDGIYLPFDEKRFQAFREGIRWLHTELEKSKVKKIIHLTPPVHDDKDLGTKGYNLVLSKYAQWLLAQKDSLKWNVADIHTPMTRYLDTQKKNQPGFKLANDGVHPGELGHWLMARSVLEYLGEKVAGAPNVFAAMGAHPRAKEIYALVSQRQAIMKDAWLMATGHKRPGMAQGLPLPEAREKYFQIEKRIRTTLAGTAVRRVRIAYIGNSITFEARLNHPPTGSYPGQLQSLLGFDYDVLNFGVSGRTLMNTVAANRTTAKYQEALEANLDIATIKVGTNDSRSPY